MTVYYHIIISLYQYIAILLYYCFLTLFLYPYTAFLKPYYYVTIARTVPSRQLPVGNRAGGLALGGGGVTTHLLKSALDHECMLRGLRVGLEGLGP